MNPIPTPTPYAYEAVQYITLDTSQYRVWSFADDAINVWNYQPAFGQVVQTAIIIILIVAFLMILIREARQGIDD